MPMIRPILPGLSVPSHLWGQLVPWFLSHRRVQMLLGLRWSLLIQLSPRVRVVLQTPRRPSARWLPRIPPRRGFR
jgi:hypothetical protein